MPADAGFYARALAPDDVLLYAQAPIGSLDEELRLARVTLLRLVQRAELEEPGTDDEARRRELKTGAQYAALVQRQLELVRKLELSRLQLQGRAPVEDELASVLAEPDEDAPDAPF